MTTTDCTVIDPISAAKLQPNACCSSGANMPMV